MADFDFAVFGALAMALGFKHAFDADHVVAISNFLTRARRVEGAVALAGSWALGHLVTAALVSAALFFLADTVLPDVLGRMELLVPIMLVLIGALGLGIEWRRVHVHRHRHGDAGPEHSHVHVHVRSRRHEHGAMAGIGVVHGLASNDELLIVLVVGLAASSWWQVFAGVGLFSLGVMVGMAVYAAAVHAASGPVSRRFGWNWVPSALSVVFSLLSIGYGVYLLGGDGLNVVGRWFGPGA